MRLFIIYLASIATMMSSATSTSSLDEEWRASFFYLDHNNARLQASDDRIFHELNKALRHYREIADGVVRQLSIAHEVALRTEQLLFPNHGHNSTSALLLSIKLEQKITRSARLLEQNVFALEALLRPIPFQRSLLADEGESGESVMSHPLNNGVSERQSTDRFDASMSLARYIPPFSEGDDAEEEPYDTASHIITHMARDWTEAGAPIVSLLPECAECSEKCAYKYKYLVVEKGDPWLVPRTNLETSSCA